jgi:hypothetical protein
VRIFVTDSFQFVSVINRVLIYVCGCTRLGLLRAKLHEFPESFLLVLAAGVARTTAKMCEQELSAVWHGLAKMEGKWDRFPRELQDAMKGCLQRTCEGNGMSDAQGLACTVYSLGLLGATWEALPPSLCQYIVRTSEHDPLVDQTLSNTLYGLGLMGISWDKLDSKLKTTLMSYLDSSNAFLEDVPQHVSNSCWALSKMDATWKDLPTTKLVSAFKRCYAQMSTQEVTNMLYGLAMMDASWSDLDSATINSLENSVVRAFSSASYQV